MAAVSQSSRSLPDSLSNNVNNTSVRPAQLETKSHPAAYPSVASSSSPSPSPSASSSAPSSRTNPPPRSPLAATPTTPASITTSASSSSLHRPGHHLSSPSISSQKPPGFLALAAAAFNSTFSGAAEPRVRPRQSLSRLSTGPDSLFASAQSSPEKPSRARPASNYANLLSSLPGDGSNSAPSSLLKDPPSKPYSETDATQPPPIHLARLDNKMHQTSSRLLRMTDDDRPFTKDFKDLFATLIVSLLPLSAHRVRLTKVEHTFLSEDAINNLGSLKFSQSNRMPDPNDPSRIVTTTTTTTFSMAKDMARSICQRFLEARFIESADGKYQQVYTMKGSVWQLTPKGISILDRFCSRNGIQQRQVAELIGASLPQLVILERDGQSDKLLTDRGTIEVIFRRFVGANGPNVKPSVSSADSDSLNDYKDGLTGVKMAAERKVGGKTFKDTFTGKAATDWLMDCSTTVDRRETIEIASLFVEYDLMEPVQQDRAHMGLYPSHNLFQPTKHAIYHVTAKGKDLVNGALPRGRPSESEGLPASRSAGIARDSNTQRLDKILNDAALRLLFRENLRETHCEENLSFYIDVDEFVRQCRQATKAAQKNPSNTASMDGIKEIMAQAYGIYNAFLAPGSPCELNIDHQLRNNLATRMTKAVGQDVAMIDTLHEVTALFEDAQNAVFKLMASDSVPKFLRNPKYEQTLKSYDFDSITVGGHSQGRVPERSQSRSNRK
ncbi:regulator of G protein signaling domain-containing protein [Podospora didyma]|uniref:Regulator of G protein signaling domain-containing protein n=1 Tax=Podospora didyma TaxID=330526 RepID=A0AAE0P0B7_9PEZI|nr:regulator of G protein signaling domain-containing protein [Podospora didyma]